MAKNRIHGRAAAVRGGRASRIRLAASTLALVAASGIALAGCGGGSPATPQNVSGTAGPATDGASPANSAGADASASPRDTPGSGSASTGGQDTSKAPSPKKTKTSGGKSSGGDTTSAGSTRCHTSELKASVGSNDPGAGQENYALVLTNTSGSACTVYGYPGFAFVDGSGNSVAADPQRGGGTKTVVHLAPGHSAWAALSFPNPGMVGGATATPKAVEITPPDEKAYLKVAWKGGPVTKKPNSAAAAHVGPFQPGNGPGSAG
ncbi:DUF4232 domain-containing protein [Streptomyces montanisoli]|uniref:DUF4232 domain-containing protein n=1 Tax=Streptomyces montanisoli TaxID=2798581 RepID=A0A940M9F1_9ACTN|nr:DUF4232 domain-containing protein [Streptomyces montanisoli]MBP0456793.1 DUF4232 domain-containing protein [Streptomyces montanisoli]